MFYSYKMNFRFQMTYEPRSGVRTVFNHVTNGHAPSLIEKARACTNSVHMSSNQVMTQEEAIDVVKNSGILELNENRYRKFFDENPDNGTFISFDMSFENISDVQYIEGDLPEDCKTLYESLEKDSAYFYENVLTTL